MWDCFHPQHDIEAIFCLSQFSYSSKPACGKAVRPEWNETCQPPWEEKDLRKKLRDAAAEVGTQLSLGFPVRPSNRPDFGEEATQVNLPVLASHEAADDPHRLAQLYVNANRTEDGVGKRRFWNGDWYRWEGLAYRQAADVGIDAELTRTIKEEFDRLNLVERLGPVIQQADAQAERVREPRTRKVTISLVKNVIQALKSECFVSSEKSTPCWLDEEGSFPANEFLAAGNGLVHLPSLLEGRDYLQPLTPRLFTTLGLNYDITGMQDYLWLG